VRGLDYYTRTAFEYVAENLGAQDAVGGGGRYDGLSESLGGPHLPGIGFALGMDRILMARGPDEDIPAGVEVFVVVLGKAAGPEAFKIATRLRRAGIGADLDLSARSMKGQMKQADRSGARWAAIVGEQELASGSVTLKDLRTGDQRDVPLADLEKEVTSS
jgi:histidyl-tRNA synthetase